MNGLGRTELWRPPPTLRTSRPAAERGCDGLCVLGSRERCDFLLSLAPPGRWPVSHTALWFSAHSKTPFSFSSTLVKRSVRLADVVFSSVSPTGRESLGRCGPGLRPSSHHASAFQFEATQLWVFDFLTHCRHSIFSKRTPHAPKRLDVLFPKMLTP